MVASLYQIRTVNLFLEEREINLKSLPFLLDQSDEISIWRAETFWTKEPETLAWLDYWGASEQSISFVDVGANIGIYTLYASSLKSFQVVFAIEPMPHTFKQLKKNIQLNSFRNIEAINLPALSSQKPVKFIYNDTRVGSTGGSVFEKSTYTNVGEELNTKTITGDSVLEDSPNQSIIKIDVDGAEFEVLKGFQDSIKKHKIISVLIEVDANTEVDVRHFLKHNDFEEDQKFVNDSSHSSKRRQLVGSSVKNMIYTRSDFLQ
jgi:FkbM family methyltransferase